MKRNLLQLKDHLVVAGALARIDRNITEAERLERVNAVYCSCDDPKERIIPRDHTVDVECMTCGKYIQIG